MAIIPTQNQYPDRAGYLGLDTDRNVLSVMSDGKMKSTSIPEGWVNVKDFGAKGDGTTDDTLAFQNAINQYDSIYIPYGTYIISDTLIIAKPMNIIGSKQFSTLKFNNSIIEKPLIKLDDGNNHTTLQNLQLIDINKHTSKGIELVGGGYPYRTVWNWKNSFTNIRIANFKIGFHWSSPDPLDGNTHNYGSETTFIHCKFRNCLLSILQENMQSRNNNFFATDIENDDSGELYTMIQDRAGGHFAFFGGSIIGRGHIFEYIYPDGGTNLWGAGNITFNACEFEMRSTTNNEYIKQLPSSRLTTSARAKISLINSRINNFGQVKSLIKYTGHTLININNTNLIDGKLYIEQVPVQGASGHIPYSYGIATIENSQGFFYKENLDDTEYGTTNSMYLSPVLIKPYKKPWDSSSTDNGFEQLNLKIPENQIGYGYGVDTEKILYFNNPNISTGFSSLKFIIPKWIKLLKFGIWKDPFKSSVNFQVELYLVKDNSLWADPLNFDYTTDAYLIATIPTNLNQSGLFETEIHFPNNTNSIWTERRLYYRHPSVNYMAGFMFIKYL